MIKIIKSFFSKLKKLGELILSFLLNVIKSLRTKKADETPETRKEPTTVFERVAIRESSKHKEFKYRYAVIGGIAAVVLSGLILLGSYVNIYSKNIPSYLCDKIVEAYKSNTPDIFLKNCTNLPEVLKDEKTLKEYFNLYLPKSDFTYYQVAAEKKDEKKYIFKSGDNKISQIVFKKQKNTAGFGIEKYKVKSFDIVPLIEYRLTGYSTFTLLINGIPADDYIFSKNTALHNFNAVLENPITKNLYITDDVNYIKDTKNIKALDSDGTVFDVVSSYGDSAYNFTIKCDEKKQEELKEYFNNFVFEYMHYTVKDDRKPQPLLDYIYPSAFLYGEIEDYKNPDLTNYKNERIENLSFNNLVYYGSGYYTCDVSADYITDVKNETVTKNFKYTIYLKFSDGKYYVVDMVALEQNQ